MTDSLTTGLKLSFVADQLRALDLSNILDPFKYILSLDWTNGTGSGKCDLLFHDERTLGDGSSENLDLAGSLTSSLGVSLTFVKVKSLIIVNKSTTQTLTVGGAASNGFATWVGDPTDTVKVTPGGFVALGSPYLGYGVTASTGDILKIANEAGATATYDIIILGASA